MIHDDGSILCPWNPEDPHYGHVYDQPLKFHTTEDKGILDGDWNLTPGVVYPDTVVAVGEPDIAGEPYRWALEFQCVEKLHHMAFFAVNFYSRSSHGVEMERNYEEMLEASRISGIETYWNEDPDYTLKRVDHTNCIYQNAVKPESFL